MNATMKHTPGPWQWAVNGQRSSLIHPHRGHLIVMDFVRLGMQGATFRLATWDGDERGLMGGIMRPAHEIALAAHPDARLIEAAPDLLAACEAVWLLTPFDSPERRLIVAAMAKAKGG
jgi:hypothetical protein